MLMEGPTESDADVEGLTAAADRWDPESLGAGFNDTGAAIELRKQLFE
jgi:hypothetical protein